MNLQPTLQDENILLQPLRETDFERLYQAASDPKIWELHPNSDRYKKEVFATYFQGAMDSKGAFIILDRKTGEVMGSSRYYGYDPTSKSIKMGYTFLTRKYWGGKSNFDFKKLMILHAFEYVDTIIFEAGVDNLRSRKALEKIGAVYSHEYELDGSPHCVYKVEKNKKNLFRG